MKKFIVEESALVETTWSYIIEAENEEQAMEKFNTNSYEPLTMKQENISDMETVIDIYEIKE